MQKAFIAIIFALAVSCAVAGDPVVTANGWAKTPVQVCDDTLTNCTNRTYLQLGALATTDVNVFSYNLPVPVDAKNTTSSTWDLWTKVVDTKALTSTSNTSYGFKAAQRAVLAFGYAVSFEMVNDSTTNSTPQLFLYQTKVSGTSDNTVLGRVLLTSNKDANFTPLPLGFTTNSKSLFYFYAASTTKVNFTSVAAGASVVGKEFTLTSTFNSTTDQFVTPVWGEALSTSQVYAGWKEGDVYKVAAVDFTSGTLIGSANLGNYQKNYSCAPYVTDKKYYGVYCSIKVNDTMDVYVSANSTNLLKMFTIANTTTQKLEKETFPYSGYFGFYYSNPSTPASTILSYEIWDVEKFVTFKNKTDYLTYDPTLNAQTKYRIPGAGIYSMLWNSPKDANSTKTKVQVGLLLEGSYLTTIFGSLMAMIAGLLLF